MKYAITEYRSFRTDCYFRYFGMVPLASNLTELMLRVGKATTNHDINIVTHNFQVTNIWFRLFSPLILASR